MVNILFRNPQGSSNFVGWKLLRPHGSINCLWTDTEYLRQFRNAQEFVQVLRLEVYSMVTGEWPVMARLTEPYSLRDLIRKCITFSRFRTAKVRAIVAHGCRNRFVWFFCDPVICHVSRIRSSSDFPVSCEANAGRISAVTA